jgi:hypothetical protein
MRRTCAQGAFAVISSARVHPFAFLERRNPEWFNSRLQKLLTKNITTLYFGLPMSNDYTSLLSAGVLTGREIDQMGGRIIGQERQWDPFIEYGSPAVTIYDIGGRQASSMGTNLVRNRVTGHQRPSVLGRFRRRAF